MGSTWSAGTGVAAFRSGAGLCSTCGSNTPYSGRRNVTSQLGRELFVVVCAQYGSKMFEGEPREEKYFISLFNLCF